MDIALWLLDVAGQFFEWVEGFIIISVILGFVLAILILSREASKYN